MNIFDYEGKEFDKKLDEVFENKNKTELKKELVECGLEIQNKSTEQEMSLDTAKEICKDMVLHKDDYIYEKYENIGIKFEQPITIWRNQIEAIEVLLKELEHLTSK